MIKTMSYNATLGAITLAEQDGALIGLWFDGQKYDRATLCGAVTQDAAAPTLKQAAQWLDQYFAGENPSAAALRLAPGGTAFQSAVWQLLREIPYGAVTTYGALARTLSQRMGKRMSAQAVGSAVGRNPLSILIPCHRVVSASGSLTGYAGGVERKRRLLVHEGVDMSRLFVPTRGTAL